MNPAEQVLQYHIQFCLLYTSTHCVRTLTSLIREKTDVHAASFFRLQFIPSSEMTELCETLHRGCFLYSLCLV